MRNFSSAIIKYLSFVCWSTEPLRAVSFHWKTFRDVWDGVSSKADCYCLSPENNRTELMILNLTLLFGVATNLDNWWDSLSGVSILYLDSKIQPIIQLLIRYLDSSGLNLSSNLFHETAILVLDVRSSINWERHKYWRSANHYSQEYV